MGCVSKPSHSDSVSGSCQHDFGLPWHRQRSPPSRSRSHSRRWFPGFDPVRLPGFLGATCSAQFSRSWAQNLAKMGKIWLKCVFHGGTQVPPGVEGCHSSQNGNSTTSLIIFSWLIPYPIKRWSPVSCLNTSSIKINLILPFSLIKLLCIQHFSPVEGLLPRFKPTLESILFLINWRDWALWSPFNLANSPAFESF